MQLKKSVVVVLVMCAVPVVYVAAAMRPGVYNFSSSEYGSMQEQAPAPPAQAPTAPASAPAPVASPAPVVTVDPVSRVVVTTPVAPRVSVTLDTPVAAPAPVARVVVRTAVTPKVSVAVSADAMCARGDCESGEGSRPRASASRSDTIFAVEVPQCW